MGRARRAGRQPERRQEHGLQRAHRTAPAHGQLAGQDRGARRGRVRARGQTREGRGPAGHVLAPGGKHGRGGRARLHPLRPAGRDRGGGGRDAASSGTSTGAPDPRDHGPRRRLPQPDGRGAPPRDRRRREEARAGRSASRWSRASRGRAWASTSCWTRPWTVATGERAHARPTASSGTPPRWRTRSRRLGARRRARRSPDVPERALGGAPPAERRRGRRGGGEDRRVRPTWARRGEEAGPRRRRRGRAAMCSDARECRAGRARASSAGSCPRTSTTRSRSAPTAPPRRSRDAPR